MIINIPNVIKTDVESIKNVWIMLVKKETAGPTPAVSYVFIPKDTLEYELSDDIVAEQDSVQLKVLFVIDGQNSIKFYNLKNPQSFFNTPPQIEHLIRDNSISRIKRFNIRRKEYINKLKDAFHKSVSSISKFIKDKVDVDSTQKRQLLEVINKAKRVESIEDKPIGTKNLIYYSAYNDPQYIEMLNLSILSLLQHNSSDKFDILIITDKFTRKKIETLSFVEKKRPIYHITKTPKDGVEASINKIKIFDYPNIKNYQNILYLDCDTATTRNIDGIFDNIKTNVLYTANSIKSSSTELFKTLTYGLEKVDDDFVEQTKQKNQYPFNAGQFLFKNSTRMKKHFENLNHFVKTWRGRYFFEQGFMNYYFCGAGITDNKHLENFIEFCVPNKLDVEFKKPIIHFAGEPLNGGKKYYFIDNFFNPSLRKNLSSIFKDDSFGRKDCFDVIDKKIKEISNVEDISYGSKNLVYYSTFFDKGYIELLDLSLKSLFLTKSIDFDVLIITDKETQKKISRLNSIQKFNHYYHIIDTPEDGVEASKTKCDVFDFKHIDDYSKILFLDTDVIAIDDIGEMFQKDLESEKIYSSRPHTLSVNHFKGLYHGFPCVQQGFIDKAKENNQIGFNAGQFLFLNSKRMKKHFDNVRWFMKNWPSNYFFEQCFMNYYFAANASIDQMLYDYVQVAHTALERFQIFDLEPDIKLIHFTAPPLDAKTKLKYIEDNIHRYKRKEKLC